MSQSFPVYECWPVPILRYMQSVQRVYSREALLSLVKWKLKDNYTHKFRPEED